MRSYSIAVLPGDGIGPEIIEEAIKVLDEIGKIYGISFNYERYLIGGSAIDEAGAPLPEETVEGCKKSDAVLMGSVGGWQWDSLPGDQRPEAGLLGIRSELGLFANLRPAKVFKSLRDASPIKNVNLNCGNREMDIMIVRELIGGIYFGERGRKEINGVKAAYDTETYTYDEVERIARYAFEVAMMRNKKLTSVDKANVLESSRLWREAVTEVSKDYPQVEFDNLYVDSCAMHLINCPSRFDVIVTSNMFGDILSDEASMISGSLGMLPSASLSSGKLGLYEPAHGSAPDIVGKGCANPLAMILSASMMLEYSLEEYDAAKAIVEAVETTLEEARTPDIGDSECGYAIVSTSEMGNIVVKNLK